ncbi:MAG: DUF5058 family protein [Clostridiaceae bacterium]|jgi:hypothetical protein|nr:DUF5058 family protein [Clostridiaceae bacterium]
MLSTPEAPLRVYVINFIGGECLIFNITLSAAAAVNSVWLYLLYIFVAVFILTQSTVYLLKSLKRAKKINMDMAKIKKVISSSVMFTILPSIGIFIGVVILAGSLGVPLPGIRLSVIGSLQYETMAADWVAAQVEGGIFSGLEDMVKSGAISAETFVTFCFAMTFGIIWGPLFCLFFYKKFQPKMLSAAKNNTRWGGIIFAAVFIGMVLAYLSVAIAEPFYLIGGRKTIAAVSGDESGGVFFPLIAVIVAAGATWFFDKLIKKKGQKWLESFSLAFSMLLGMSAVAGVNAIFLATL